MLKAIKEAIKEYIDMSEVTARQSSKNENKQVLIIFTSKFDMTDLEKKEELNNIIMNIHALGINIIVFGYELCSVEQFIGGD